MDGDYDFESAVNEVDDVIARVLAVLEDVKGAYTHDQRIHAAIAALKHARDTLQPVIDTF